MWVTGSILNISADLQTPQIPLGKQRRAHHKKQRMQSTEEDFRHMYRALELAEQAQWETGDNPWVGCVIVKDSEILGEGRTHPPGQDHAEAAALRDAEARGHEVRGPRSTARSNPARSMDAPPARNCSSARTPVWSSPCAIHTPRSTGPDSKSCVMVICRRGRVARRAGLPQTADVADSATGGLSSEHSGFGVLNPEHFWARLLSLSMMLHLLWDRPPALVQINRTAIHSQLTHRPCGPESQP